MTTPAPIDVVRAAKRQFVDFVAPHRPDLYRYARALTRSPWDAEDLVQETLARAFARMGDQRQTPETPRAYLLRMASNAWIDQQRRAARNAAFVARETAAPATSPSVAARDVRESMATLATALAPQERAAIVLKDVLDLSLEETADLLGTTANAVKAALHRGRERLGEAHERATDRAPPSPRVIDAFVAAFNARDTKALASMLLANATADVVGFVVEHGREEILRGSIHHTLVLEGGDPRAEARMFGGETIVAVWHKDADGVAVDSFVRFETAKDEQGGEGVAAIHWFYFCPEVIQEVGEAIGVPVKTCGYQH